VPRRGGVERKAYTPNQTGWKETPAHKIGWGTKKNSPFSIIKRGGLDKRKKV